MSPQRRSCYPPNWNAIATACKQHAHWKCQVCRIRHGAERISKRTGAVYQVWLHAAHVYRYDTLNPRPALRCLCPTCHGRYDAWQRQRERRIRLERMKHQRLLQRRCEVA